MFVLILWFCCPWQEREGKFNRTWITSKSTGWCIVGLKRFTDNETLQDINRMWFRQIIRLINLTSRARSGNYALKHNDILYNFYNNIRARTNTLVLLRKLHTDLCLLYDASYSVACAKLNFFAARISSSLSDYLCSLKKFFCRYREREQNNSQT